MTIEIDAVDVPFGGADSIQPYAQRSDMVDVEQSRAEQETQAGFIVAHRFPRNEQRAIERLIRSCQRKNLAEQAEYAFPRGGQQVSGPSIRLAEVIAQNWGNMAVGIRELQAGDGMSMMLAYAYDLETNLRMERIFSVKHERKARGQTTQLTDARDIYEMTANQGARRLRACILAVVPGDVVEIAVEACRATLEREEGEVSDRIGVMLDTFKKINVTKEMIEARMGKNAEALLPADLRVLRTIYTSIKDGMSNVSQWFTDTPTEALKKKLDETKKKKPKKKAKKPAPVDETAPNSEPETEPDPEPVPEPETVTGDSEQENDEEDDDVARGVILSKMKFRPKPGPTSQWQTSIEARMERGTKALEQLGDDDPEYTMTLSALQLLEVFDIEDIESLPVDGRLQFRNALDQVIQGIEKEITGEEEA